jgi:hypothetical protein
VVDARDLFDAMVSVVHTGKGRPSRFQHGMLIKWKQA